MPPARDTSQVPPRLQKFVRRIENQASASGHEAKVARLFGAWAACYVRYCTMTSRDWRTHENVPYFLRYLRQDQGVGAQSLRRAAEGLLFVFEEMMSRNLDGISWRPPAERASPQRAASASPEGEADRRETGSDRSSPQKSSPQKRTARREAGEEASEGADDSSATEPTQSSLLTRLLFHTSLPIQEAMDLRVGDVDLEAGMIYVSDAMGTPKQIVEIPDAIGDELAVHISDVRDDYPREPLDAPLFQANALKGRTDESASRAPASSPDADADASRTTSPEPAGADDASGRSLWQYAES
jgi:integrase